MTAPKLAGLDEDLPFDLACVRNAVARELHAQLAMRGEKLELEHLPEAAYAVAVQLAREFQIRVDPSQYIRPDEDALSLDSAAFYGSKFYGSNQEQHGDLPDRYPI
jgi:hypothetical protein